jgi:hypothetical protein
MSATSTKLSFCVETQVQMHMEKDQLRLPSTTSTLGTLE